MSIKIYKDGKWQVLPGVGSPGKSAYQIAVENGYFGTEEEFNEALVDIPDVVDKIKDADSFPKEDSDNLITSGGVYKALKNTTGSGLDIDLEARFDTVEEDIVKLRERVAVTEDDIEDLTDRWKDFIASGGSGGSGDYSCCDTLRSDLNDLENRVDIIEATGGSGSGVDVEALKETFDNRYLIKVTDSDQSVDNKVDFNKDVDINSNLTVDNIKSTDFVSGMSIGGAGFSLYNDETEDSKSSVLEVDKLYVRKEAHFAELVIDQIRFSLGETVFSNGGATISSVDESNDAYYKCYYEKTKQENGKEITGIESGFVVNDLARCQRFDAENKLLKYYWCKVVEVGDDYFCLSKTDKDDSGLDISISKPEAGDDVVQLGNATETDRQSAVIISPFNGGSVAIFSGINSYTLSERNYIGLGTYKDNGVYKSKIYGYGDMYFGVRPDQEGHYIKFDGEKLTINGDVIIGEDDIKDVTINNKTLINWLNELAEKTDQYDIDFWSGPDLVVDGKLDMSDKWISDGVAESHLGDRYTCTTDGTMWQFTKQGEDEDATYAWVEQDSLSNDEVNNLIQSALDGHRRVFTAQPKGPYDVGDLWISTSGDLTELYICVSDNNTEGAYSESDWKNVTETAYAKIKDLEESIKNLSIGTDDSVNFYFDEKEDILNESNSWSEDEKQSHIGDLAYAIDEDKSYKWDGTSWSDITGSTYHNILKSLYTTSSAVDGKIEVTFCPNEPVDPSHGDLYYNCNKELLSWDSDNDKWVSLNDLTELEYLTSLFKNSVITDGVVIGDMLAVVDSEDNVVAGIYGGGNDALTQLEDDDHGTRMIFAGAENFDSDATFATSIWSDGHLETNSFALNNNKVAITDDEIIIGDDESGKIFFGFDSEVPYLKYTNHDGTIANSWDLRKSVYYEGDPDKDVTVEIGGGKITYSPYTDNEGNIKGRWEMTGDLLVTGGVSFYSTLGDYRISTIMDGVEVDGDTIDKNESGQLYVKNAGSGSVDESVLKNYYTKTEVDNLITGGTDGEINLDGYVSRDAFPELFTENFNTSISDYLKKSDAESTYATKSSLDNYLTTEEASNYALKTDLEAYLTKYDAQTYATNSDLEAFKTTVSSTYATIDSLNDYYTKDESDSTFLKLDGGGTINGNLAVTGALTANTINGGKITYTDGVWQLEGDLLVTGGVSFYSTLEDGAFSTLVDYLETGSYITKTNNVLGIDYSSLYTAIKASLIDDNFSTGSGSIDTSSFASKSDLEDLRSDYNSFLTGSDADTIINKWSELEVFLSNLTESDNLATILSNKADASDIPTAVSQLTNDEEYLTSITKSMVTDALGYTPYNSTNPNGYITTNSLSGYVKSSSLATVATSGSYSDLSNKPTIPTVNNATLTLQWNGSDVGTFTANASSNKIINFEIDSIDYADSAGTATTATNLTSSPSLTYSGNSIYVTAGGKKSSAFTVPYATKAGSAAKLAESVSLWGQSFDGSSDISGAITTTGNITINKTNPVLVFTNTTSGVLKYAIQTASDNQLSLGVSNNYSPWDKYCLKIDSTGNVTIPGNLTVSGGITFYSQRSLKNIHETDFLSLDQLSNIHTIKYTWKDGRDDRMHVGGIADDIKEIIPEVIYENDGYLTMDYGNAGFVIGTSLIKPVVDHEKRIKDLEAEVERLTNLLNA